MIRHIVSWQFADGFTPEEKKQNAETIKARLLALKDIIPEIEELDVCCDMLPGSNCDFLLSSLFKSQTDLDTYAAHPEHIKIGLDIKTLFTARRCADFIV